MSLNEKQKQFIRNYLRTFNAKQSAIASGYSEKTAESQGSRLLSNAKVQKQLDKEMKRLRERMAEDGNKFYAMLWDQVEEINERLNRHYNAEKKLFGLSERLSSILREQGADSYELLGDKREARPIYLDIKSCYHEMLPPKDASRMMELRTKTIQDLFDRAGFKSTDKMHVSGMIEHTGTVTMNHLTDEELEKELSKFD